MKKIISLISVLATVISLSVVSGVTSYAVKGSDEGVLPFDDFNSDAWYSEGVVFCYANSIMNGMNEYTFAPAGKLTRAQFVTILANVEGVDTSGYSVSVFDDVKSGHWYYSAVAWAYDEGIVSGTSENSFSPNLQINRQTLARMMSLYMIKKGYEVSIDDNVLDLYTDKGKIDDWAVDGIKYMVSSGLMSGMTQTTIGPKDTVNRAQAARILMTYVREHLYGDCEHSFTDNDCTNPPTCTKCGMIEGMPEGHVLPNEYSCTTSAVCLECGVEVAPSKVFHDFADATCGKPRICKLCGVSRGEPTGKHDWWAASCTNPKMCKVCYKTEGKAQGHSTPNGYCTRCKKYNFTSVYDQRIYFIKTNGKYDSADNVYYVQVTPSLYVVYYLDDDIITFEYINHYKGPNYTDMTVLEFTRNSEDPTLYFYYLVGDTCVFIGSSGIDASEFSELDGPVQFEEYEGTHSFDYEIYADMGICSILKSVDSLLYKWYGGSIDDYGFVSFPLPY